MTTRHPFLNKRTKINFTHTRHVTPHHRLYTPYGYETNMMQRKAPREINNISRARASTYSTRDYILSREIAKQWDQLEVCHAVYARLSSGHIDNKSLVDSQSKNLSTEPQQLVLLIQAGKSCSVPNCWRERLHDNYNNQAPGCTGHEVYHT